jgi:hypothetical protein
MNKKTITKIKKAMSYQGTAEQKRVLKSIKKQYSQLPHTEKRQLILDLHKTFNHE